MINYKQIIPAVLLFACQANAQVTIQLQLTNPTKMEPCLNTMM